MAVLREAISTFIKLHDRPLGLSISMRCRRALVVRSAPVLRPTMCLRWRDKKIWCERTTILSKANVA